MMNIREAGERDLPDILTLYKQPDMDGDCLDVEQAALIFQKIKSYPDYHIYVAESDGKIVGTYSLTVLDNLVHSGAKTGIIEAVVVKTDCQGNGIGKAMMTHAIDLCREKKCYKAVLSSSSKRTKAHQFYEGLGFKRHGVSFSMTLD
jgi:GNAT superfamily N-acetyltransferase